MSMGWVGDRETSEGLVLSCQVGQGEVFLGVVRTDPGDLCLVCDHPKREEFCFNLLAALSGPGPGRTSSSTYSSGLGGQAEQSANPASITF